MPKSLRKHLIFVACIFPSNFTVKVHLWCGTSIQTQSKNTKIPAYHHRLASTGSKRKHYNKVQELKPHALMLFLSSPSHTHTHTHNVEINKCNDILKKKTETLEFNIKCNNLKPRKQKEENSIHYHNVYECQKLTQNNLRRGKG